MDFKSIGEKIKNGFFWFIKEFWKHLRKSNSWQGLVIHSLLMLLLTTIILVTVFNVWMPSTTNHGQSQLVPDFEGKKVSTVKKLIESEGLRFQVFDTVWSPRHSPKTIVSQNPKGGAKVKKNRMIYLTINSEAPPKVIITDEIYKKICRVPNAQAVYELRELGLKVKPKYVKYSNKGFVYDCTVDGKSIKAGDQFQIGTTVLLTIGKGTSYNRDEQFHDSIEYDE